MARISSSKYQTLQTCKRLFYFEHVLYLERIKTQGARDFGTMYHKGLEAWWKSAGAGDVPWVQPDLPLVHAMKAISENATHIETDKYDVARAEAMMIGYHGRWFDLEFERIGEGTEVWFEIPLRDPDGRLVSGWQQIGRKDALVQFADRSQPEIIEHKTTNADIVAGADYWVARALDLQPSFYVDAAIAAGYDCKGVLYDVSRKPKVDPERETPIEKREMTIGRGCKTCGGSAKAGEIKKGSGVVEPKPAKGSPASDVKLDTIQCPACNGTGWKPGDEPRYKANVNEKDEDVNVFRGRVVDAISENPEIYYKQAVVPRKDSQLADARANVVAATVEIDDYYARARKVGGDFASTKVRQLFPQNTASCLHQFGRRCDFLEACTGTVDVLASNLYRKKEKGAPK